MWIGAIRVGVWTKDSPDAGTDSLVRAEVLRDGQLIGKLRLDYPTEDDLERGAFRDYFYYNLGWDNDKTPPLAPGTGQYPMPYPDYGYEFSSGLPGHLKVRLHIYGDDMWVKDHVDFSTKEVREVASGIDTVTWQQDANWKIVGNFGQDVALSTDSDEGFTTWTLNF